MATNDEVLRRLRVGRPLSGPPACPCARLLDHLVRLKQERRGDGEAEGLGSFQVDPDIPTSTLDFFFFIRYIRCLTSIAVLALDGGGHHEVATAQTAQSLARPLPDPATGDGVARTRPHQRLTR